MVHTLKVLKTLLYSAVFIASFAAAVFAQDDPPTRVARLNYINGNVSMEPAGVDDWAPAIINRPFTVGDYLYTDQSSVAELHLDNAVLRAGQLTSFGFLNLTDQAVQIKMTEGDMYIRIHDLSANDSFEVDTPNAAINLLREGVYRIHVDPNANTTFVFAKTGEAEVTGGGQAFTLNPGNSASLSGTDQLAFDIEGPPAPDAFDNWCAQRDERESQMQSRRYVPPTVVGSEDLDEYGTWNEAPQYGPVWYPRSVPAGWAPYHSGHWAWIEPWGWTWVDDNPWGFAPFHYGRWVYWQNRWGWAPGPCARVGYGGPVVRPVYAPALVAFFGGAHWGVSVAVGGGGPSLGWVPLGWGEVYTPSYHCSPRYFNNVNVNNTRIVNTTNITNVYKTVYVNKTVYNQTFVNVRSPNAVAAMPQSAFASGRPVTQAGSVVTPAQLTRFRPAQAALIAPPVAPTRQAVTPNMGRPAAAPPAHIAQRQVIARNTPPPAPSAFAARQAFLQQHAGQPHDFAAMRQATVAQARVPGGVREVARVQPAAVHQGEHVGNVPGPVAGRTPGAPGQQPNRPLAATEPTRTPAAPVHPGQTPQQPHGAPPNLRPGQGSPNNVPERPAAARPQYEPNREPPNAVQGSPGQPGMQHPHPAPPAQAGPGPNGQSRPAARPQYEPNREPPNAAQGTPGPSVAQHPHPVSPPQARPEPYGQPRPAARPQYEGNREPPNAAQSVPAQPARPPSPPQPRPQPNMERQPGSGAPSRAPQEHTNQQQRAPEAQPNQQPRPAEHPQNAPHEGHGSPPRTESKPDHKDK